MIEKVVSIARMGRRGFLKPNRVANQIGNLYLNKMNEKMNVTGQRKVGESHQTHASFCVFLFVK